MTEFSPGERYLRDFHDRVPAATSHAFSRLPAVLGDIVSPSSYHLLTSRAATMPAGGVGLDLACGDGYLLRLWAGLGLAGRLVGVDISGGDLGIARKALPDDVVLLQGRAQALAIADAAVDMVLSHMALMLMDDIELVLQEIRRVLVPAGELVAVVGRGFLLGEAHALVQQVFREEARNDSPSLRIGDRRTGSVQGWLELLQSGFTDCLCQDVDVPWHPTPVELWQALTQTYEVDRLPSQVRSRLGARLVAALAALQDETGRVPTGWTLRLVCAHAA